MAPLRMLLLSLVLLPVAALAPAAAQPFACAAPQAAMMEVELMFGRHVAGRLGVTEARFADFVAREVTPRFPDGLTIVDAAGQWRDAKTRRVVREPSKMVRIVVPAAAETDQKIDRIVAAYKARFRQDAVGVLMRPVCASFGR
jgi:hypothetical protein